MEHCWGTPSQCKASARRCATTCQSPVKTARLLPQFEHDAVYCAKSVNCRSFVTKHDVVPHVQLLA